MMALSGTQPVEDIEPRRSAARVFARLGIAIVLGSYVVNAMDRTLFPLILPEVRGEYGFALPEAGLMSTVFTIGMALAGLPTGYLMSRYARKSVAQIGMFIFSAATIATVLAPASATCCSTVRSPESARRCSSRPCWRFVSSYFARYRAVGIGALNCFLAWEPCSAAYRRRELSAYESWRAPMIGSAPSDS